MTRWATSFVLLILAGCAGSPAPVVAPAPPTGPYLGQTPPGSIPVVFAPGVVSTGLYERDLAWTPDGHEVLWTVFASALRRGTIVTLRQRPDGIWIDPEIPSIFVGHDSLEPFVTADGRWLWFASTRPLPGESAPGDWNLWRAPRTADGWGTPEPLPPPISEDGDEYYPSLTRDGTVYFTAKRDDSLGEEDIYRCRWNGDAWGEAEHLGPGVNTAGPEFNALVAPDGSWIVFGSLRDGDLGGGDLYLSRADGDGWTPARALPAPIDSPRLDFCPSLSPDGRWFFFTSTRATADPAGATSHDELVRRLSGPGNGFGDVYWVAADVLAP